MASNYITAVIRPAELLARHVSRWAPLVLGFSMVAAIPEILVSSYARDFFDFVGGSLDTGMLLSALMAMLVLLGAKFIVEFATFMFVFIILADITAGRPSDLGHGLRRLASWRLQFSWIIAGLFEQVAISMWFLGAGLVLIPFGLWTTAAYEEDSGMAAAKRSMELGMAPSGGPMGQWPGLRLAIAVTIGFLGGAAVNATLSAFSFASGGLGDTQGLLALAQGDLTQLGALIPAYGPMNAVMDLIKAPIALIPTVYMMTAQQMTYWECRKAEVKG